MPKSTIFLPANFGIWAGPGYAGGQYSPDPARFAQLFDRNTGVKPVGFLDAAARNHDLAYEYAERAYGAAGTYSGTATQKQEMRKQVQFLADLDLMANALQFRPATDDFIGRQYRDMIIKGFYYVAVREYGMGAHVDRLWKSFLQSYDPGYSQPKISDTPFIGTIGLIGAIPDFNTATSWGATGLELLTTSDFLSDQQRQSNWGLTEQEMLLFNQHIGIGVTLLPLGPGGKPEWEYGGELNARAFGDTLMAGTVAIPKYAGAWSGYGEVSDKAFIFVGHLNDAKVTMVLLNVDDPAHRDFVKVTESAGVTTKVKWLAVNGQLADDFGNRPYTKTTSVLNAEGIWDPVATEVVAAPTTPALKQSLVPVNRWTDKVNSVLTDANTWNALGGLDALDKVSFQTLFSTYPTPTNYTLEDILDAQKSVYPDAASLAAAALTSIELRFALLHLEPFIRKGGDFTPLNANGELNILETATGKGQMTREYLADRATLLFQIMHDPKAIETYATRFEDAFLDFKYGNATAPKKVLFGKDAAETLAAGTGDGHLYGGSGADTLTGNGGDDYLQGDAGVDTLLGGDGADTLIGGQGNDTLNGGSGEDTYLINSGDGADQIIDSGINRIRFNGKPVVGAFVKDIDGKFKDLDSGTGYTIAINSPAVLQLDAGTTLTFANDTSAEAFNAEGYGLRLVDTLAAIETTRSIVGDLLPIDLDPDHQHSDGQVHDWTDDLGNVNVTHVPAPGRGDTLYGSAGNDLIQGKGGDDWIDARGGADRIEGDAGRDILNGGDGKDLLLGGIEADLLLGGAGDDHLFADLEIQLGAVDSQPDGSGRELLAGGEGNDLAVGAATSDALFGGAGNDLLLGGAGDDDLLGDRDVAGNGRDWTLTREIISGAGIIQYKHSYGGDFTSSGEAAAGADILYGGAGNDWLFGGGGNDVLDGGGDDDILFGEAGKDIVEGGGGNDILNGDEIDDGSPVGLAGNLHGADYLDGGDGADKLTGNGGADELFGGANNDELAGDDTTTPGQFHGADYLDGEDGNDKLWGQGGNDDLFGGDGDDHLEGDYSNLAGQYQGNDYLDGEAGNDELIGGGGNDTLYGDAGDDVLVGDDTADAPLAAQYHGADHLDGGEGKDSLYGGGGKDTLQGGAGDDNLYGDADDDMLIGGTGTDNLFGGDGDDTYQLIAGDGASGPGGEVESIEDTGGSDMLRLEGLSPGQITAHAANGDWLVIDYGAADRIAILNGLGGAIERIAVDGETLGYAQFVGRFAAMPLIGANAHGNAIQLGGADGDTLSASGGHATLSGGRGNDSLSASGDGNRILYGRGDGTDRVVTGGVGNVLGLGAGIAATDLKLGLGSLALHVGDDPGDVIHFDSFDPADALGTRPFDTVEFEDGGTLAYAELLALGFDIEGGELADTLSGTSVDDRIDGGAGDDSLAGGGGSDTYLWGRGGGQDTIDNADATPGKTDLLRIGNPADPIAPEQLDFLRSGDDLVVRLRDGGERVTVLGHYAGAAIDAVEFADGTRWDRAGIDAHLTNELSDAPDLYNGTPGGDTIDGRGGNDTLNGLGGDDRLIGGTGADTLKGGAGNDTLEGGSGNDELRGETGNDIYRFGPGGGQDTLYESDATPGNVDTIELEGGLLPEQIGVTRNINHLYLTIKGTTDKLSVVNHFLADASRVEQVRFGAGPGATVWDAATLQALTLIATEGADTLIGYAVADSIDGLGGNDTIDGQGGDDILAGGSGNDTMAGGAGNDQLDGGEGNDSLAGGGGDDLLDGGAGNDVLHGEAGNDSYRFGRGAGQDVINDNDATAGNVDTVEIDADVAPEQVTVVRSVGELALTIKGTTDKLRLLNYFSGDAYKIEQVRFAGPGAAVWDGATLLARSLLATDGADSLMGGADAERIDGGGGDDAIDGQGGGDTLIGGSGNDTLTGGQGGDSYRFERGFGADTIVELAGQAGDIDVIEFAAGIGPEDVVVNRVTVGGGLQGFPHLRLDILRYDGAASGDSILVKNFFQSQDGANRIEQVRFADDATWEAAFLGATPASGTQVADTFLGDGLADDFRGLGGDDTLWGYGGNDLLVGGAGNDTLYGGLGNDTYRFGRGDGADTVSEVYQGGGSDTLQLGPDIQQEQVSLYDYNGNLVVVVDESATQLTVSGFFQGGTAPIERIRFAELSEWDIAAINARAIRGTANAMVGGPGDDGFTVDHAGDTISEGLNQGTDTVYSRVAWTLGANLENLTLTGPLNVSGTGNALNNVILGNVGNNVLDGRDGVDTLIGGRGDDTYYVSPLVGDTVVELAGEGIDLLIADFSVVLPPHVENLSQVSGYIYGVTSTGNELDNVIYGRYGRSADVLDGRAGNDTLVGSVGNDTYRFAPGGGHDTIVDPGGTDRIVFDEGVSAAAVTVRRIGTQVVLSVSDGDSIRFAESAPGQFAIEQVAFAGGPVWQAADLRERLNAPPSGAVTIDGAALRDRTLTATNTLADADGLGAVGYRWQSSADGAEWIDIAGATAPTFTLTDAEVGRQVRAVAAYVDGLGKTEAVASAATARVAGGTHQAPGLVSPLPDLLAVAGRPTSLALPAGAFADPDGDALTLSASRGDGSPLPVWLGFDAGSGSFTMNAPSTSVGSLALRVSATDPYGAAASDDFILDIAAGRVGTAGNDTLTGTAYRDVIEGLAGDDSLNGGAGADILVGGPGGDGYAVYSRATQVIEAEGEGVDTVRATCQYILPDHVENLILTGGANNQIGGTGNALDNAITGNESTNTLNGLAGNDTLDGGAGDDLLVGGTGDDTYVFGAGHGADRVRENDAGTGDAVRLLAGIAAEQIWLRRLGNDLEASRIGTTDRLTVENWYLGPQYRVEEFRTADGRVLVDSQVEALVQAMAGFAPPGAGETNLPPGYQETLAPLIAANWS